MPLREALEAISASSREHFPAEVLEKFTRFADYVRSLGIEASARQAGEMAPAIRLPATLGGEFDLSRTLTAGPAAVVFFRGRW